MLPRPQLIFPSKTWFSGIYLKIQQQKSIKNQLKIIVCLPLSESKYYQINIPLKSCSSRSFQQQHQRHIPISPATTPCAKKMQGQNHF